MMYLRMHIRLLMSSLKTGNESMSFVAESYDNYEQWDYICGDPMIDMSIMTTRYYFLLYLNYEHDLKVAFRDPDTNSWTKWDSFPGLLYKSIYNGRYLKEESLQPAVDVHRGVLENEIVIESDYPEYEQNYEATKIIGAILEHKGFIPHYYYSGNKSIHTQVYIDWSCINEADVLLREQIISKYHTVNRFKKVFITWLRKLMISGWNTNIREFDTDLIRASHLIRCELSKNKLGYKTFLGYTHRSMSFIPYVCNETNRIYPRLGEIKLSKPKNIDGLLTEFLNAEDIMARKKKVKRKEASLSRWMNTPPSESLRECVRAILSDEFIEVKDGTKRGMFILVNELKRLYGVSQARILIYDWNKRLDIPINNADIDSRFNQKDYTLSCDYIHKFLESLKISTKCKGKIYK